MFLSRLSALAAIASATAPQHVGWPTGVVHHNFFDTPSGQLHYVTSGLANADSPPIVYMHSHPRSSSEVQYVLQELKGSQPFLAVDWFGMGFSDDYAGADDFCKYEEFIGYVLDILAKEDVEQFIPMGWMKGASPAAALAAEAGPSRISKVVLVGMLVLSPDQQSYIANVLVPMLKKPTLFANGSHLMDVWEDPSATSAVYPEELLWNQDKTNDALRSLLTNWQMQAAWPAYNEKIPSQLAKIDEFAETLVVHPLGAYEEWATYGLDPTFSLGVMDKTFVHGHNTSLYAAGMTEGALHQNASYLADVVRTFISGSDAITV